jgi:Ribonuclease G/E
VFAELGALGEGFVRLSAAQAATYPMGTRATLLVEAEPQGGKRARLRVVAEGHRGSPDAFDAFLESIPGGAKGVSVVSAQTIADADRINDAFEEALPGPRTLPGGGVLTLSCTRAMSVFDIDSHGRVSGGARALNLSAVAEAGRLMALGEFGGLGVIDCVAPVAAGDGEALRRAFLEAVRAACQRGVQCLLPSRLGLVEVSLARGFAPIAEVLTGRACGEAVSDLSEATLAVSALAQLERALMQARAAYVTLSMPLSVQMRLETVAPGWSARLARTYGQRFAVDPEASDRIRVRHS